MTWRLTGSGYGRLHFPDLKKTVRFSDSRQTAKDKRRIPGREKKNNNAGNCMGNPVIFYV